ncbi:MAG: thioredoxin family protein, partial [Bacteroidaceae bacterium]|nr:thioredoxin family protein [Bacteroidaceae bacterium]
SKDNTLIAQLCLYQQMLTESRRWQTDKESKYAMFSNTFTHPYVKAKADEFYSRTMAQTELATPIPDAPMADLIRSLCAKYPGKILMIDFWGMGCGPCRGAIQASKELRAEIAKRDDVKLIFIAGERTADGSDAYKKYVAEWLANEETVCVTNADFTRLQELFQFNGIPHYETITPDCRRVRDDLRIDGYDNFDYELTRLKERLK